MDFGENTDLIMYIGDNFDDIEDNILAELENNSEEYRDLLHETSEMDDKYPFIWQTLYGEGDITLTAKEHAILFEYLMMENEMHTMERRAIYLRGCMDTDLETGGSAPGRV